MYFKTTVIAGKTIEVMKGYKRKVAKGKRAERSRLTPEEMDKVNQKNAAKKLRQIIFSFSEYISQRGQTNSGRCQKKYK